MLERMAMGIGIRLREAARFRAFRGSLARRFLLKLKRATHRGPAQLIVPEGRRVLVIAPHMDDEVIPCGGTLLLLRDQDAEIHVTFVSDSSGGLAEPRAAAALNAARRAEARRVGEFMRFASTTELGMIDGQLHRYEPEITARLSAQIDRIQPDLILCPFPADAHSDHMTCSSALAAAAMHSGSAAVILAYEVWTPLWPNVAVDITRVAAVKEAAIRLYASQCDDRDYAAGALGLNRYRGLVHSVEFAEAFFQATPAQFARICSLLNEI